MSPLPEHETWKKVIGQMIQMICIELNITMRMFGSTTFRRQDRDAGLEPDECYYIQHADAVRANVRIDLAVDPPPDLALEIDITHRSVNRQPIYAALGVPELWRFDGKRLAVLVLTSAGTYEERPTSRAFPFVPMAEFSRQLELTRTTDDTTTMRAFQQWVRTLRK
jgi:Uma2 family endonuclease